MDFGSILGSISPAFGMASGQGLGSYLKYLSPLYDMGLLGGGKSPVGVAGQQPLAQMGGHNLAAASAALPGMSNPSQSPFAMIGNALMKGGQQGQTALPSEQAYAPQQSPIDMSIIAQLLGSLGRPANG